MDEGGCPPGIERMRFTVHILGMTESALSRSSWRPTKQDAVTWVPMDRVILPSLSVRSMARPIPTDVPDTSHSHPTASLGVDLESHSIPQLYKTFDIEHMPVEGGDDPRAWSSFHKNVVLCLIASASMIAGLAESIQNPAISDMEADLPATASQISLSLSLFIALQGVMPLFWSAISEVKGRKLVYVVSLALCTASSAVVATSKTIQLVIAFRCLQATGSSAVGSIGAATLSDIYDPVERGTKMGIYYIAPLLGPSLAPLMGGVLTTAFNWRAPFWFLTAVSALSCVSILLFLRHTFRQERSLTYQNVLKSRLKSGSQSTTPSSTATIVEKEPPPPTVLGKQTGLDPGLSNSPVIADVALAEIKLTLRDVNPVKPLWLVVRRMNNLMILFASGLMFAFSFVVSFTASRTLSSVYGYNALTVGLVLLSFGLGSLAGSVVGGRWSDIKLADLKAANGGVSYPEMRLRSTKIGLIFLPPSVLAFGWVSERHVHVSAMCVFLFLSGFFLVCAYTSTLAYIVDANNGRSATAVAANSAFRGLGAFVATEVAVPLQNSVGDGWHYTIWTGLMILVGLLVWLVVRKGETWREAAEKREQGVENHGS
ncbi:vacuolar DHA amino acid exporter [Mycena metata]|uniref:Vacuolar DHA amino acid exporter n=1 Tax=Mycena metata TaxID=1033252 RepID=A0AAD7MF60_9AGAR|nr:vacuolar DHA amino acid exporter [Mycena metata]